MIHELSYKFKYHSHLDLICLFKLFSRSHLLSIMCLVIKSTITSRNQLQRWLFNVQANLSFL